MPIRFRCKHCKQNLGISRSKAGDVVDCPTCGRSIKVPRRDGQAEDVDRPQMNFHDPKIADAMAELQSLGNPSPVTKDDVDRPVKNDSPMDSPAESMPIMLSEPEVDPVPVLEIAPIAAAQKSLDALNPSPESDAEQHRKELEGLANQADELAAATSPAGHSPRLSIPMIGGLVLAFGLLMGLGIGYLFSGPRPAPTEPEMNASDGQTEEAGAASSASTASNSDDFDVLTVNGVITYDPENATTRPDSKSLVCLLAESRLGQVMIPGESLWEPTESSDFQVAAATLKLIGGRAALTDADGEFSIVAPETGSYHLLVVSRHAVRESSEIDADLEAVLKKYFEQPRQLLGKRAYHVVLLNVNRKLDPIRHRFKR